MIFEKNVIQTTSAQTSLNTHCSFWLFDNMYALLSATHYENSNLRHNGNYMA